MSSTSSGAGVARRTRRHLDLRNSDLADLERLLPPEIDEIIAQQRPSWLGEQDNREGTSATCSDILPDAVADELLGAFKSSGRRPSWGIVQSSSSDGRASLQNDDDDDEYQGDSDEEGVENAAETYQAFLRGIDGSGRGAGRRNRVFDLSVSGQGEDNSDTMTTRSSEMRISRPVRSPSGRGDGSRAEVLRHSPSVDNEDGTAVIIRPDGGLVGGRTGTATTDDDDENGRREGRSEDMVPSDDDEDDDEWEREYTHVSQVELRNLLAEASMPLSRVMALPSIEDLMADDAAGGVKQRLPYRVQRSDAQLSGRKRASRADGAAGECSAELDDSLRLPSGVSDRPQEENASYVYGSQQQLQNDSSSVCSPAGSPARGGLCASVQESRQRQAHSPALSTRDAVSTSARANASLDDALLKSSEGATYAASAHAQASVGRKRVKVDSQHSLGSQLVPLGMETDSSLKQSSALLLPSTVPVAVPSFLRPSGSNDVLLNTAQEGPSTGVHSHHGSAVDTSATDAQALPARGPGRPNGKKSGTGNSERLLRWRAQQHAKKAAAAVERMTREQHFQDHCASLVNIDDASNARETNWQDFLPLWARGIAVIGQLDSTMLALLARHGRFQGDAEPSLHLEGLHFSSDGDKLLPILASSSQGINTAQLPSHTVDVFASSGSPQQLYLSLAVDVPRVQHPFRDQALALPPLWTAGWDVLLQQVLPPSFTSADAAAASVLPSYLFPILGPPPFRMSLTQQTPFSRQPSGVSLPEPDFSTSRVSSIAQFLLPSQKKLTAGGVDTEVRVQDDGVTSNESDRAKHDALPIPPSPAHLSFFSSSQYDRVCALLDGHIAALLQTLARISDDESKGNIPSFRPVCEGVSERQSVREIDSSDTRSSSSSIRRLEVMLGELVSIKRSAEGLRYNGRSVDDIAAGPPTPPSLLEDEGRWFSIPPALTLPPSLRVYSAGVASSPSSPNTEETRLGSTDAAFSDVEMGSKRQSDHSTVSRIPRHRPIATRRALRAAAEALCQHGPWALLCLQPQLGIASDEQGGEIRFCEVLPPSVFQTRLLGDECVPTLVILMAQWRQVQRARMTGRYRGPDAPSLPSLLQAFLCQQFGCPGRPSDVIAKSYARGYSSELAAALLQRHGLPAPAASCTNVECAMSSLLSEAHDDDVVDMEGDGWMHAQGASTLSGTIDCDASEHHSDSADSDDDLYDSDDAEADDNSDGSSTSDRSSDDGGDRSSSDLFGRTRSRMEIADTDDDEVVDMGGNYSMEQIASFAFNRENDEEMARMIFSGVSPVHASLVRAIGAWVPEAVGAVSAPLLGEQQAAGRHDNAGIGSSEQPSARAHAVSSIPADTAASGGSVSRPTEGEMSSSSCMFATVFTPDEDALLAAGVAKCGVPIGLLYKGSWSGATKQTSRARDEVASLSQIQKQFLPAIPVERILGRFRTLVRAPKHMQGLDDTVAVGSSATVGALRLVPAEYYVMKATPQLLRYDWSEVSIRSLPRMGPVALKQTLSRHLSTAVARNDLGVQQALSSVSALLALHAGSDEDSESAAPTISVHAARERRSRMPESLPSLHDDECPVIDQDGAASNVTQARIRGTWDQSSGDDGMDGDDVVDLGGNQAMHSDDAAHVSLPSMVARQEAAPVEQLVSPLADDESEVSQILSSFANDVDSRQSLQVVTGMAPISFAGALLRR